MVVLSFYIVAMTILLPGLLVALVIKNKELINRGVVLVLFVSVMTLAIWQGAGMFAALMFSVTIAAALEMWHCMQISSSIGYDKRLLGWALVMGLVVLGLVAMIGIFGINKNHLIAIILLVQFNDSVAYMIGRFLGKTRIPVINKISPNKTLEGYLAGFVGVIMASVLLHTLVPVYGSENLGVTGFLVTVVAFVFANSGDLLFSFIKRKIGVKDFSRFLGNHGGILDRFDSMILISPIYFALLYFGIL